MSHFAQKRSTLPRERRFAKKPSFRQKSVIPPKKRHFATKASFLQKSVISPQKRLFSKKASLRKKKNGECFIKALIIKTHRYPVVPKIFKFNLPLMPTPDQNSDD